MPRQLAARRNALVIKGWACAHGFRRLSFDASRLFKRPSSSFSSSVHAHHVLSSCRPVAD